jgi:signal transduction histidine kinase
MWTNRGCSRFRAVTRSKGSPERNDILLALALGVPSLAQVLIAPIASIPVGIAIAIASTAPLAWRRSQPVTAALVGSLPWLIPTDGYLLLGYVAAFFLFYSLAAYVPDVRVVIAVSAFASVLAVVAAAEQAEILGEYVGGVTAVIAPAAVGRFVRRERRRQAQLKDLTLRLERERERMASAAVDDERARIARELHDVVSHGVNVIAIQAEAADAALQTSDPALASGPLHVIRESAQEALAEMRTPAGDEDTRAPMPRLEQLPALLERARAAGADVSLRIEGEARPLPASLDLSAYRIVQEALTNARKHARGAPAEVALLWGQEELRIEVADGGPGIDGSAPSADGHGLVGMIERARLHDGDLELGRSSLGGTLVSARLPYGSRGNGERR